MKYIHLYLIFFFVLSACHSEKKQSEMRNQSIDIIQIRSDFKVGTGINLSSFVKNIDFIPLEVTDESLLRGIGKAAIYGDYIYVIDDPDYLSPCVYQFDKAGKFIRQIGAKGEGPEEFVEMRGFVLDKDGNICIYDGVRKKILIYKSDGTFLHSINTYYTCDNFEYNDGYYYLYRYYPDDYGKIRVLDSSGKELRKYLERPKYPISLGGSQVIKTTEKDILCYEALNDTVYNFDGENMKVKYIFDFGKYSLPLTVKEQYMESMAKNKPLAVRLDIIDDYITEANNIWETENRLFFSVVKNSITYFGFYDKRSKSTDVNLQTSFNDDLYYITGLGDRFVGTAFNNSLIASQNANYIKSVVEKYLPVDVRNGKITLAKCDSITKFFSCYLPINFERQKNTLNSTDKDEKKKTLAEVFSDMYGNSEELNPMLMIIHFKD